MSKRAIIVVLDSVGIGHYQMQINMAIKVVIL